MDEGPTVGPWKNEPADPELPALPIRTPATGIPRRIPAGKITNGHTAEKGGRS
jgi:hypothetical protein